MPRFDSDSRPTTPKIIEVDFPYPDEQQTPAGDAGKSTPTPDPHPRLSETPVHEDEPKRLSTDAVSPGTIAEDLLMAAEPLLFRDMEGHFRIEQLPGWEPMTSLELGSLNSVASRLSLGTTVRYQAGFRRFNTQPGTFPYILIQTVPLRANSYAEVERALEQQLPAAVKKAEHAAREFAESANLDTAELDRASNRVVMQLEIEVRGVGLARGYSIGHIGREAMVFVHSYALASDFPEWSDTFERFNESFQFDEGYEFVEQPTEKFGRSGLLSSFDDPITGALTSVAVSLGSVILGVVIRKIYRAV